MHAYNASAEDDLVEGAPLAAGDLVEVRKDVAEQLILRPALRQDVLESGGYVNVRLEVDLELLVELFDFVAD